MAYRAGCTDSAIWVNLSISFENGTPIVNLRIANVVKTIVVKESLTEKGVRKKNCESKKPALFGVTYRQIGTGYHFTLRCELYLTLCYTQD